MEANGFCYGGAKESLKQGHGSVFVAIVQPPHSGIVAQVMHQMSNVVEQAGGNHCIAAVGSFGQGGTLEGMLKLADGFLAVLVGAFVGQDVENISKGCGHGFRGGNGGFRSRGLTGFAANGWKEPGVMAGPAMISMALVEANFPGHWRVGIDVGLGELLQSCGLIGVEVVGEAEVEPGLGPEGFQSGRGMGVFDKSRGQLLEPGGLDFQTVPVGTEGHGLKGDGSGGIRR